MANADKDVYKENRLSFSKKVWIAGSLISLMLIFLFLFKTLLEVLLLILAGVLIAIYFHGFAGIFKKYFHWPSKLSIVISVFFNLLLLIGFFWFVGARLQQQVSQLSETLPATIENAKEQMSQTALGSKALQLLNSTGDSEKTMNVVKRFFSSGFGVLSDLYIVFLLGLFFTVSPSLYKKGIVSLLPAKAKDKGKELTNRLSIILKKWLEGQIIGFFFIAILTAIGLVILGMPLVLTLALIAGLLNFIPNFGPIIALIPAVLISLMQGPGTAVIIVCMYTFIQIIQTSVTQPLIEQKMISIPPALTVVGQVALGMLTGFWGVLLAVPVMAILMTVIDQLYIQNQEAYKSSS